MSVFSALRVSAFAVSIVLLLPFAALAQSTNILQSTLAEPDQKTPEVSTQDVRKILADNSAIILDTRPRAQFVAGHIPGARNLDAPAAESLAAVEKLVGGDRSKPLVLTCNGPFCEASRRMGAQLVAAGFTNVRRYQLGIPVWRAFGGPTEVELEGIVRIFGVDRTAVYFDARTPEEFARGSLPGAHNVPASAVASGALEKAPLPNDDFNRRVVLFGRDGADVRALAVALGKRPWANVMYFPGAYEALAAALKDK